MRESACNLMWLFLVVSVVFAAFGYVTECVAANLGAWGWSEASNA